MTAEPALRHEPAQEDTSEDKDLPLFGAAELELPPVSDARAPGRSELVHRVSVWPGRMIDLVHHKLADTRFALEDGHVRVEPKRGPAILLVDFADATQSPRPPVMVFKGGEKVEAAPFLDWLKSWDPAAGETPDYAALFGLPKPQAKPAGSAKPLDQIDMFAGPAPEPAPEPTQDSGTAPEPTPEQEPASDAQPEDQPEDTPAVDEVEASDIGTSDAPVEPASTGVLRFPEITFESSRDEDAAASLTALEAVPDGSMFSLITGPARGILVLEPTGAFRFTPEPGYAGIARFSCRVTAPGGAAGIAEIGIAVDVDPPATGEMEEPDLEIPVKPENSATPEEISVPEIACEPEVIVESDVVVEPGVVLEDDPEVMPEPLTEPEPAIEDDILDLSTAQIIAATATEEPEPEPEPEPEVLDVHEAPKPAISIDAPNLWVETVEEIPVGGNLLVDAGVDPRDISVVLLTPAANGFVVMSAAGDCAYTPAGGFVGTDSFTYRLDHASGASATAIVSVRVEPARAGWRDTDAPDTAALGTTALGEARSDLPAVVPPPPPARVPEVLRAPAASAAAARVTLAAGARYGTVVMDPHGAFTYVPNPDYQGTDAFSFRVTGSDGADLGMGDIALFIGVSAPAAAPDAANEAGPPAGCFVTYPGRPVSGSVLAEEAEADLPAGDFEADAEVEVPLDAAEAGPEPTPSPEPPRLETPEPERIEPESAEPEKAELLEPGVEIIAGPDHGLAELDDEGAFTYTPDPGFIGRDSFLCRIVTGDGSVETTLVAVDVDARGEVEVALEPGSAPDSGHFDEAAAEDTSRAEPDFAPTPETDGGSVILTPDVEYVEPGGGEIAVPETGVENTDGARMLVEVPGHDEAAGTHLAVSEPPSHGTLELVEEGFIYAPSPGFTGPDRFTWTLTDATGRRETASVELMIDAAPPEGANSGVSDRAELHDVWHVAAE